MAVSMLGTNDAEDAIGYCVVNKDHVRQEIRGRSRPDSRSLLPLDFEECRAPGASEYCGLVA